MQIVDRRSETLFYYDSWWNKYLTGILVEETLEFVREFLQKKIINIEHFHLRTKGYPEIRDDYLSGDLICFFALHHVMNWRQDFNMVS